MKILHEQLPQQHKPCIATIGVFDGIHYGHRYILHQLVKQAAKRHLATLVITFDIAPQEFLRRKTFDGYINDRRQKVSYIAECGINYLWFLKTSRRLLGLSGKDFIAHICKYFDIKKIIVGEDFRFGQAGSCGINELKRFSHEFGFSLQVLRKRSKNKKIISSSLIRGLIQQGRVKELAAFLGRPFALRGRVVEGKHLGSRLGFPTANVSSGSYTIPLPGVYAAYVLARKKFFLAALFVNRKQAKKPVTIEAHLIGFKAKISGENIAIFFLEYLRKARAFHSQAALRSAIQKDIYRISAKYSVARVRRTQLLVS